MAMVHIRRVRVGVLDPFVRVRMAVRLDFTVLVRMPVVLVVDVQVLMLDRIVDVLMRVLLPEQEQDAAGHERRRDRVASGEVLAEKWNGQHRRRERRRREERRRDE